MKEKKNITRGGTRENDPVYNKARGLLLKAAKQYKEPTAIITYRIYDASEPCFKMIPFKVAIVFDGKGGFNMHKIQHRKERTTLNCTLKEFLKFSDPERLQDLIDGFLGEVYSLANITYMGYGWVPRIKQLAYKEDEI